MIDHFIQLWGRELARRYSELDTFIESEGGVDYPPWAYPKSNSLPEDLVHDATLQEIECKITKAIQTLHELHCVRAGRDPKTTPF